MGDTKPLSPLDAKKVAKSNIPEFVIQGVNAAIANHYKKGTFTITQKEIVNEIMAYAPTNITRNAIFENHWLDFEELYRNEGWLIEYDKPGYCESYEAYFKFKSNIK